MRKTFITLEGTEACGKTTQISRLRDRLEKLGKEVVTTREPGGTPLGEELRHLLKHAKQGHGMVPEAEILLFTASRAQLAREVIGPALERGAWVLSDRYGDSTVVYQGVARKLPLAQVKTINWFAMGDVTPGLTLILDIPEEESWRRLLRRPRPVGQEDRMEKESTEFFARVRQGYAQLAKEDPDRVRLIDANASLDEVEKRIWEHVKNAFGL
jgi:dTMP kinase